MLTVLKNNRSLTFYNPSITPSRRNAIIPDGITAVPVSNFAYATAATTSEYSVQLNSYLSELNSLRRSCVQNYDLSAPNQTARNRAVELAWKYEKADIEMGGSGSANWTDEEKLQIRNNGKVDGAEGHHQQNVSSHPEQQANPDNIKFYKTKEAHLKEGHNGSWSNESNEPMIDKNGMLKITNSKRALKNELSGLAAAVAIAAGVGIAIGFVTTLAENGISPDSIRLAAEEGLKSGLSSAAMAVFGYAIGRTVGAFVASAVTTAIENAGVEMTTNLTKAVGGGVVGVVTIAAFAVYYFIKLRREGYSATDALILAGKQAMYSLSLLAVSIIAQMIWGGAAGIIVSTSIGLIFITYSVATSVYQHRLADKIRVYAIEKSFPLCAL